MWTELFMDNRENLMYELDTIIGSLQDYRKALEEKDYQEMEQLLAEGRTRKEEIDG